MLSEESPWYYKFHPKDARWRLPFAPDEKCDELQTVYRDKLNKCLQHDSEEVV